MGASPRSQVFVRHVGFTLLTACIVAAMVIQDHTGYLPLGVFNTGADVLARISDGVLVALVLVLIAQVFELVTGRLTWFCRYVRDVHVFVIVLNVLLIFGDRLFVTGNPAGTLGQYHELPHSGRPPVILKKDMSGAPVSPCLVGADSAQGGPRILFLGDSYTEGSGRSPECNYVDVAGRVLREQGLPHADVINAGVSGYGPVEALSLLRWYRDQHCPVNAIVYNLTLQNDLADNLPGTERRVVAGIIFRFPRNQFLRTFHPLNTRLFRWALVLVFFGRASTQDMLNAVDVPGGPCDLSPAPLAEVSPFLRATVERDIGHTRRVADSPVGYRETVRAIEGMHAVAGELGVPFFLVVFPDRILVDTRLQSLLGIPAPAASAQGHAFVVGLEADHVLDMVPRLAGRPGMFRAVDTHLSDLGNVVAGECVGTALAEYLGRTQDAK